MSLQQRDLLKKNTLDQQIKSVNLDINILNNLSKKISPIPTQQPKTAKLSLNTLSNLLKNKNQKFAHIKQDKHQTQDWLKNKGVDFKKIHQQLNKNVKIVSELGVLLQPKKVQPRSLQISMLRRQTLAKTSQLEKQVLFTQDFQTSFINKQKQVVMYKGILKSMKNNKPNNAFRGTLLNKIKQFKPNEQGSMNKSYYDASIPQSPRFQNKALDVRKNQYFDFSESLAKLKFNDSLPHLKKLQSFWPIVLQHLKTVQHYIPQLAHLKAPDDICDRSLQNDQAQLKMNAVLMHKSLKMIEHNFSKQLPDVSMSYDKLNQIIRHYKKQNAKLNVWYNSNGQPSWALAFIFLRAGRKDLVKRVLQKVDRQFLELLMIHEQTLATNPQPCFQKLNPSKYKDNFYQQLYYILTAQPKFDTQVINEQPLTKLWIILRVLGIYCQDRQMQLKFDQLKKSISQVQCKSPTELTLQKVQNFLYLGMYKQLIYLFEMQRQKWIQKNQGQFSFDDQFHLLTILNYYPQIWGNTTKIQKNGLQNRFVYGLLQYMKDLRKKGYGKQTAKYLLLSPPSRMMQVAYKFIKSTAHYEQFDWQSFRYLLNQRKPDMARAIYLQINKQVVDRLQLKTFDDYLYVSKIYRNVFSQFPNSSYLQQKCLVKLLMSHLFYAEKKKYLLHKTRELKDFNNELFRFFGMSSIKDDDLRVSKKANQINLEVINSEELLDRYIARYLKQDIDNKLSNKDAEMYFKNIEIPYRFYKNFKQLSRILQDSYENLQQLRYFESGWYNECSKKDSPIQKIKLLLQFLSNQLPYQTTSLYVFYITSLIQRKRILCNKQCDYSGLTNYIRNTLKQLQSIDISYRKSQQEELQKRRTKLNLRQQQQQEQEQQVVQLNNPLLDSFEYGQLINELSGYMRQYGCYQGMQVGGQVGSNQFSNRFSTGVNVKSQNNRLSYGESQFVR